MAEISKEIGLESTLRGILGGSSSEEVKETNTAHEVEAVSEKR